MKNYEKYPNDDQRFEAFKAACYTERSQNRCTFNCAKSGRYDNDCFKFWLNDQCLEDSSNQ